ncbi:DUF1990 domain-containing protein [Micromonospora globispora]|uniref:DUF1990 domain-containing protein n=1 Tax=Micromonospora globispora TaxID=1450148 RepID=A0A317KPI4_9ACTN|nr:DUF1990 domain-containing protein [Micromonospora globispora]PWU53977.1 DUF1990 domain-containing protein [Micromonospora globispora]PWU55187.1 DUF1990 domain-containing protein [Micromonospora globispora]
MPELTYPDVGATREGQLPTRWRHVRHRVRLPVGSFAAAGQAVLSWRLHGAAGIRIDADTSRAAPGVRVVSRLGVGPLRLAAPCAVVWAADDDRQAGFGYGTLPGHPARGEEAFVVTRDDSGAVWFEVRAFSRPDRWYMRAAGPVGRTFQHGYAWWLGRTLRRLCTRS